MENFATTLFLAFEMKICFSGRRIFCGCQLRRVLQLGRVSTCPRGIGWQGDGMWGPLEGTGETEFVTVVRPVDVGSWQMRFEWGLGGWVVSVTAPLGRS
ncbi:hypothetical protein CRG98_017499 [Punica granatum]|uniref:Uncharacterized protein n=1 Tax=Punica granatum TaxID=22663 RepID=A0A2I0K344_PUNGR|nr:hypothetical protein CRG98_017499 [Punica granatum]